MVSFLFASHVRIATRKLRRLTKGMPDFRSRHSYSGLDTSPAYEGSASFSRLTSVSRPGSFGVLRRVCPVFTHNVCISAREVPTSAKGQLPFRVSHPYRDQQAVLRMRCTLRVLKDDGLSSGPTAPRYPSSFTNHKINSTPETSKLVSGVSSFYASLILKTLTSFRPCRRRLRALPERVP